MRDENKRDYWVAIPKSQEDGHNSTVTLGYDSLAQYSDIINEYAETSEIEKFGLSSTERVRIAHDDNDDETPDIAIDYAVWLEKPSPDMHGLYQNPPFLVESVQRFGRKHIFVLKRTVYQK